MKLVFSPLASGRLLEIKTHIAKDDPAAADRVLSRLRQALELLADFPSLAPFWRDTETRAFVVTGLPYRVHYRVKEAEEVVEILTVAHVRRRPPY